MQIIKQSVNIGNLFFTSLPDWLAEVDLVEGGFFCHRNLLSSLKGCPKVVKRDFWCHYNQLTSLEGAPQRVGGNFYCHHNLLTSLQGCPKEVDRDFYCYNNPTKFTEEDIRKVCNISGVVYL